MHRVHVAGVNPPSVQLPPGEAHHVTRVLRLGPGDEVIVFDGAGHEWLGRIASAARNGVAVDLLEARTPVAEPAVRVTLGIGVLKGDQMDAVVRDATMLGVSAIRPFISAHVAVSERASRARSLERWERVAVSSAKQCGRAFVPAIEPVARLGDAVAASRADVTLACVEPALGGGEWPRALARPGSVLLLIGPEGGWAEADLDVVRLAGAQFVGLGPRVLRAETAPTVALSVLWTVWGWR